MIVRAPTVLPAVQRHYACMTLIRQFEERAVALQEQGLVVGPLHLSTGQEAVAVGACDGLRQTDVVLSTHRGHHHCIAKGANLGRIMAELLGRSDGYARGRGGSMHLADPAIGLLGTNGIVGGGLPIAVGAGYGIIAAQRDDIVVAFFGEGATANGVFSETLNLAALWKLPIVFVCENNRYVEFGPANLHVAGEIYRRADSYGIPGVRTDGCDVEKVRASVSAAVMRARDGYGPTLVEAMTYRWGGHHAGDTAVYRPDEELDRWRQHHDPIVRASAKIGTECASRLDAEAAESIETAVRYALASPPTTDDDLRADQNLE